MLVMGKNAVRELLKGTRKIFNVYAQEGFQDKELINEFQRKRSRYCRRYLMFRPLIMILILNW